MAKKPGELIEFAELRQRHRPDFDAKRSEEERGANSRQKILVRTRKGGQLLHHWTFKGWTAPSPFFGGDDEVSHNGIPRAAGNGDR